MSNCKRYVMKQKYIDIANTFTYAELCHIEQALESFNPDYPINEQMVSELKENVTAARGWLHHIGKSERTEE